MSADIKVFRTTFEDDPLIPFGRGARLSVKAPPTKVVLLFLVFFGLGALAALWLIQVPARVTAAGVLEPADGLFTVPATINGVIRGLVVQVGSKVTAGEVIAKVSDTTRNASGTLVRPALTTAVQEERRLLDRTAAASLQAKEVEINTSRSQADALRTKAQMIEAHILQMNERLLLARKQALNLKSLSSSGFLSPAALEKYNDEVSDREDRIEQERMRLRETQDEAERIARDLGAKGASLEADRRSYERQRIAIGEQLLESDGRATSSVVAPISGTVGQIYIREAEYVAAGEPIALIMPSDSTLEAKLFLSARETGFVRPGQRVTIRYTPFPQNKYGSYQGSVQTVDIVPRTQSEPNRQQVGASEQNSDNPVFLVRVALDKQVIEWSDGTASLRVGTPLEAAIDVDKKRAIFRLFPDLERLF